MRFPRRAIAAILASLLVGRLPARAADPRVGVMTHFAQGWSTSWADVAAGISVANVRDELYWSEVEASPGVYAFPGQFDGYMAKLGQDHIAPLVILDFENPLYDGDATPYTGEGVGAYAAYCNAVLQHYGSQIKSVEIWNEYNGGFCTGPATDNRAGYYTAMLKSAYAAIKRDRPDVTVVGGATASVPLPYWQQLFEDGALPYMDALSVHPYRYDSPPEGIENDIAALNALVQKYNKGQLKPIWVTEVGWQEQTNPLRIDDTTLAKYATRAFALLLSAGVEHVYWYLLKDDYGEDMGLFSSGGSPKSAALAVETLSNELSGAPFVARDVTPDNVYSLLFQRANGEKVRIMWSLSSRAVHLGGVTGAVDMLGNPLGTSGGYTLSDAPIFVEGDITGVPAPTAADESILTSSEADFSGEQGYKGWTYGYVAGSGAFTEMPTYTNDEWDYYWTAAFPYLSATAVDMHPSLEGSTNVSAVRRWTSGTSRTVHLVGDFQGSSQGDGVGVSILLDGRPVLARQVIGGANSTVQARTFDFREGVAAGDTIDFVVDVGPASDMNFDATNFSLQILATGAAAEPQAISVRLPLPRLVK